MQKIASSLLPLKRRVCQTGLCDNAGPDSGKYGSQLLMLGTEGNPFRNLASLSPFKRVFGTSQQQRPKPKVTQTHTQRVRYSAIFALHHNLREESNISRPASFFACMLTKNALLSLFSLSLSLSLSLSPRVF